jgi:hypothetical protein
MLVTHADCRLKVDNSRGLIFPAWIRPICGTADIDFSKNKFDYFEIIIVSNENSNEVARIPLLHRPDKSVSDNYRPLQISFSWNLRGSKSNHYVEPGCYTVSLIGKLDEAAEVNLDSIKCKVVDKGDIPTIIRSLKHSHLPDLDVSAQRLFSHYLDIIEDIEYNILERLRENQIEDPSSSPVLHCILFRKLLVR